MADERTYDAEYYDALGIGEDEFREMLRKENELAEEIALENAYKNTEVGQAETWWEDLKAKNPNVGSTLSNIQLGYYEYNDITQRMEKKYINGSAPLKGTNMYYQDIVAASNYDKLGDQQKVSLHKAAQEGRLFFFTATSEKHSYARLVSRVNEKGIMVPYSTENVAQDLPSAEEPVQPKGVGWWSKVKAFFGNAEAKKEVADYNKSYNEYVTQKQKWDNFFKDCKTPKEIEAKRQQALIAREIKNDTEEVSDVYTRIKNEADKGQYLNDYSYDNLYDAAQYVDDAEMNKDVEVEAKEIPVKNEVNEPKPKELNVDNPKQVNVDDQKQVNVGNPKQVNADNQKQVNVDNKKQANNAVKQKKINKIRLNPAGINNLATSLVKSKAASKAKKMDDVVKLYRTAFLTLEGIKISKEKHPELVKSLTEQGTKLYAQIKENRQTISSIVKNYANDKTIPQDKKLKTIAEINLCNERLSKSIFVPKKVDVQGPARV